MVLVRNPLAKEATDLNLETIRIVPPPNSISPIFIGSNQALQLLITGTTFDDNTITVSPDNRRWTSSNTSVLSVSDNGVVVGQAEGTAEISVRVAGSVALEPLSITVSNAPLLGIARIASAADVNGAVNDTLDPCLPVQFTAVGNFGAGDERPLLNVIWNVDDVSSGVGAEVFTTSASLAGTTLLVGRTPSVGDANVGPITLTATAFGDDDFQGNSFTDSRNLMVANSLTSLTVSPSVAEIPAGSQINLTAPATYSTNTFLSATTGVDWSITTVPQVGTVQSVGDNPGLVTATNEGLATVTATCGAISAFASIDVSGDLDDLSFNISGNLVLDLEDGDFDDLQVSRGSEFNAEFDETEDDAIWESSDTSVLTVVEQGDNGGDMTLLSVGTSIVSATVDNTQISITVEVE